MEDGSADMLLQVGLDMNQLRYVKLCYSPGTPDSQPGILLLVIQEQKGLRIVIRSDWDNGLSDIDREYLAELMSDWNGLPEDESRSVMDQLSELSIGPLHMVDSGFAEPAALSTLIHSCEAGEGDHAT